VGELVVQPIVVVPAVGAPCSSLNRRDIWAPIVGFPLAYTLAFQRGRAGEITGFRLFGDGVRGLWFQRDE
jgi:hypothetical protein